MRFVILALGIGAHVASTVLHHYSGWLLAKLVDGGYLGLDLAQDAIDFARWLLRSSFTAGVAATPKVSA